MLKMFNKSILLSTVPDDCGQQDSWKGCTASASVRRDHCGVGLAAQLGLAANGVIVVWSAWGRTAVVGVWSHCGDRQWAALLVPPAGCTLIAVVRPQIHCLSPAALLSLYFGRTPTAIVRPNIHCLGPAVLPLS